MDTSLIFNKLTLLITFEFASTKVINIFWLFTNEMLANL